MSGEYDALRWRQCGGSLRRVRDALDKMDERDPRRCILFARYVQDDAVYLCYALNWYRNTPMQLRRAQRVPANAVRAVQPSRFASFAPMCTGLEFAAPEAGCALVQGRCASLYFVRGAKSRTGVLFYGTAYYMMYQLSERLFRLVLL